MSSPPSAAALENAVENAQKEWEAFVCGTKDQHRNAKVQTLKEICKLLAGSNVTVAGLDKMFEWIRLDRDTDLRCELLDLLGSFLADSGRSQFSTGETLYTFPDAYIELGHSESDAIAIPPLQLGVLRGYSFTALIFLDPLPKQANSSRILYRFTTKAGEGVEAVLRSQKFPGFGSETNEDDPSARQFDLFIRVKPSGAKTWTELRCTLSLTLREWKHIVISHSQPYLASSVLTVFVDAVKVFELPLIYPTLDDHATKNIVGQAFAGRIARLSMFDGALTDKQAEELYLGQPRMKVALPNPDFSLGINKVPTARKRSQIHEVLQSSLYKKYSLGRVGHLTSEGIAELRQNVQEILKQAPGQSIASRFSPRKALANATAEFVKRTQSFSSHESTSSMSSTSSTIAFHKPFPEPENSREEVEQIHNLHGMDERNRKLLGRDHRYDDLPIVFAYDPRTCIGGTETRQDWQVRVQNGVMETISVNGKRKRVGTDSIIEPLPLSHNKFVESLTFGMPTRNTSVYARLMGQATAVLDREKHPSLEPLGGVIPFLAILASLLPAGLRHRFHVYGFSESDEGFLAVGAKFAALSLAQSNNDSAANLNHPDFDDPVPTVASAEMLAKLIITLGEALYAREIYREQFLFSGGFSLIGWILQHIHPGYLRIPVIKACLECVFRVGAVDPRLRCDGLLMVLFDHRIWSRAESSAQVYWAQRLSGRVEINPLETRIAVGVQTVLDVLEACWDSSYSDTSAQADDSESLDSSDDSTFALPISLDSVGVEQTFLCEECVTPFIKMIRLFFQTNGLIGSFSENEPSQAQSPPTGQSRTDGEDFQKVRFQEKPGPISAEVNMILSFVSRHQKLAATGQILEVLANLLLPLIVETGNWEPEALDVAISLYDAIEACGGINILVGLGSTSKSKSEFKLKPSSTKKKPTTLSALQVLSAVSLGGSQTYTGGGGKQSEIFPDDHLNTTPPSPSVVATANDSSPSLSPGSTTPASPLTSNEEESQKLEHSQTNPPPDHNGLLSPQLGVPARVRAAMLLLVGRHILLEDRITTANLSKEKESNPAQYEGLVDTHRSRRQQQFGIILRSLMPIQYVASLNLDDDQVAQVSRIVSPGLLDSIVSVILGGAVKTEEVDDFVIHDDTLTLAVPEGLPVLGGLLAALSRADEETKSIAARDILLKFTLALKASHSAREQVTSLPRWQTWLLPVMLLHDNSLNQLDDQSADYLLGEVATDLLCSLMEHETQRDDDTLHTAKKRNRSQAGWSSWQGLAESTLRINKEKERSRMRQVIAAEGVRYPLQEINALIEIRSTTMTARVLRMVMIRVWERTVMRIQPSSLGPDAIRNFLMTLAMVEETLLMDLNLLRLRPLSPGGVITSLSASTFQCANPSGGPPLKCSLKCLLDGKRDTKWADAIPEETEDQFQRGSHHPAGNALPWVMYKYPEFRFKEGDEEPRRLKHRIVLYIVRSAFDLPELDPAGWTLFGRSSPTTVSGTGEGITQESRWVILDRRTEIRFSSRYQPIPCWVRETGFFEEYKIVFDPPSKKGKHVRAFDGRKVFLKVQVGEITFYECDVQSWHRDISTSPPKSVMPENDLVAHCLSIHGGEMEGMIKMILQILKFIRSARDHNASPREAGSAGTDLSETETKMQFNNLPKFATARLLGHILRHASFLKPDIVESATALVRSFLADDLDLPTSGNQGLIAMILHCIHHSLCVLQTQKTQDPLIADLLFATLGPILSKCSWLPIAQRESMQSSLDVFFKSWRTFCSPHVNDALERVLEAESFHRTVHFRVERSTSTAMARRANPVEVAAYGAGKSHRPSGLDLLTEKKIYDMKTREDERIYTSKVNRVALTDQTERKWRKLLERDEVMRIEIGDSKDSETNNFRHRLFRLGPFVDPQRRVRLQIVRNPNGNPHFGAASGVADRLNRKREKEEEEEKQNMLFNPDAGQLSPDGYTTEGMDSSESRDSAMPSWEDFGAKLSKQISIADMSLMTKSEEEEASESASGRTDRGQSDEIDAHLSREASRLSDDSLKSDNPSATSSPASPPSPPSPLSAPTINPRKGLSVITSGIMKKTTSASSFNQASVLSSPVSPGTPVGLGLTDFFKAHRKMTLEQWVHRPPDPLRGETKQPWPSRTEIVLSASRCFLIRPEYEVAGRLIISQEAIYFDPDQPDAEELFVLRPRNYDKTKERAQHESEFVAVNSHRWSQELCSTLMGAQHAAQSRAELKRHKRRHRKVWLLTDIDKLLLRRYRMRDSAFELFVSGNQHESYFFDFDPMVKCDVFLNPDKEWDVKESMDRSGAWVRNNVLGKLWSYLPQNVKRKSQKPGESIRSMLERYTRLWQERRISNFSYLMKLNQLSGRSTNDLTQYPVFPWVLQDYTSEELNLNNPDVYRDLSKPMGALTEDRLMEARERYRTFEDPSTPKFHYGSHYSTMAGVVLYFLVRLEPFTSLHIKMQDGHFDLPDRLFNSIPGTWRLCTTAMSEVKEITPEFYSLPEFLVNHSSFNLGTMHDGKPVGDVELPPWAKGSASQFVTKMRDALESEHVSQHLHLWIDLIFGHKARLPDAAAADNVFYYLTYPGAVNIDAIKDPAMRLATELQIKHFGQCPLQLFSRPHPKRGDPYPPPHPLGVVLNLSHSKLLDEDAETDDGYEEHSPNDSSLADHEKDKISEKAPTYHADQAFGVPGESGSVVAVRLIENRALCIFENGDLCGFLWGRREGYTEKRSERSSSLSENNTSEELVGLKRHHDPSNTPLVLVSSPESIEAHAAAVAADSQAGEKVSLVESAMNFPIHSLPLSSVRRKLKSTSTQNETPRDQAVLAWSRDGTILAHAGFAVGSAEVYFMDTDSGHLRAWSATIPAHFGDLTSIAINGGTLVSGSDEGAVRVWDLLDGSGPSKEWGIAATPRLSLVGHFTPIQALAVSETCGLVFAGSSTCCLLYNLCSGKILRSFPEVLSDGGVLLARISESSGTVVIVTKKDRIHLYRSTWSSPPLAVVNAEEKINDLIFTKRDYSVGSIEVVLSAGEKGVVTARDVDDELRIIAHIEVWPHSLQKRSPSDTRQALSSISLNKTEEAILVGALDGSLLLVPLPNLVNSGAYVTIPVVGSLDMSAKLASAKNAVLAKIDKNRVFATARGVASEAVGVAAKFARGFTSVFGVGKDS